MPGQVQLAHGGQRCTLAAALGTSASQGQPAGWAHVEDFTCGKASEGVSRGQEGLGDPTWSPPGKWGSLQIKDRFNFFLQMGNFELQREGGAR